MATSAELKQNILNGGYDQAFAKLYGADTATVAAQRVRYVDMIDHFEENFGTGRTVCLYSAPGRTEIGGNHTDHNNGVVIAAAVNLDIIAVVAKNDENVVRVISHGFGKIDDVNLRDLTPQPVEAEHSASLIRGVAAGIVKDGGKVGGFDCYTTSDVLGGSGLSSSAAFEVCMGAIFRGEYNDNDMKRFDQVKNAMISQYAENVFFGKPCGLMDQTASSVGGVVAIDFADPARPQVEQIPLDFAATGHALCILDSGAGHADLTAEYAAITAELGTVCRCFGKEVLREVPEEAFLADLPRVRVEAGDRAVLRAFHFYAENRRAGAQAQALKDGDFDAFLALVRDSGRSSALYLQNVVPTGQTAHQELLLAIALCERILNGKGAVRVHGGGFGGTVQAFVPADLLAEFQTRTEAVLGAGSCHVLSIRPAGGVRLA